MILFAVLVVVAIVLGTSASSPKGLLRLLVIAVVPFVAVLVHLRIRWRFGATPTVLSRLQGGMPGHRAEAA